MSQHDDLTSTLSRELAERAETMDGSLLHLADVQGRARSIRRRRTTTAVAGVAAAVAVIIPTVSLATHTSGKPEPGPATHSPSQTESAKDDGQQPPAGVLDVRDLPTGEAPAIDFVQDGVYHFHDGGSGAINTQYTPSIFAALDDGARVWQTIDDEGNAYIEIQDADGTFHEPVRSDFGLKVNREHNSAGWVTPDGQVMVWAGRASEPRPLGDPIPGGHDIRIAAILSQDCTEFCDVYVNGPKDGPDIWQPYEVTDDGTQVLRDGGLRTVDDVAGGLTVGKSEITDFGSCSDLFGGGEFQGFSTCKAQFDSFSPDGSTLLGYLPYFDGIGSSAVSMWSVSGDPLFERKANVKHQAAVAEATWEDDTHVIATVFQENTWSLVRIGTDGSMEYAVPPTPGQDVDNPFILPTGGVASVS
jgi:hypothetical protein